MVTTAPAKTADIPKAMRVPARSVPCGARAIITTMPAMATAIAIHVRARNFSPISI
jgi:hypothetical protein